MEGEQVMEEKKDNVVETKQEIDMEDEGGASDVLDEEAEIALLKGDDENKQTVETDVEKGAVADIDKSRVQNESQGEAGPRESNIQEHEAEKQTYADQAEQQTEVGNKEGEAEKAQQNTDGTQKLDGQDASGAEDSEDGDSSEDDTDAEEDEEDDEEGEKQKPEGGAEDATAADTTEKKEGDDSSETGKVKKPRVRKIIPNNFMLKRDRHIDNNRKTVFIGPVTYEYLTNENILEGMKICQSCAVKLFDDRQGKQTGQFNSALQDLKEALKLAPNNRELKRLLVRVKEECKEQAKLENAGSLTSINEIGRSDIPDIVPTLEDRSPTHDKVREETAL